MRKNMKCKLWIDFFWVFATLSRMAKLNPAQLEAVLTIDGPLLINAWAWSGKTHTITERVVYMIQEKHIDPRSIFCVTFTNKAAREMRERIAQKLWINPDWVNPFRNHRLPIIGTFHSTAAFFLRMFIDKLGYGKDFVIYDSDDCLRVVKEIMREQNVDEKEFNPRGVHGMISQTKGKGMNPSEFAVTVDSYFWSVVLEVYKEYYIRLKKNNALDFDDLLLLFRRILDFDDVLTYFHDRFHYFMVDEYQDTNALQYETIRILASKTKNLCVVGDDWQWIYSWRGADIKNILSFKKDYPNAKVINLEENYRSTQTIINAANEVIKNNTNQMKKTLFTSNPVGAKICIIEWVDEKHEADLIANKIKDSISDDSHSFDPALAREESNLDPSKIQDDTTKMSYSSFSILYRTNGQSRLIEEALIRKNIPYRVFWGMKFYERKEIKDILAYIRIIYNPSDIVSLKRIINIPSRKIGERTLEELMSVLWENHLTIFDLVENYHYLDSLSTAGQKWVIQFLTLYGGLRNIAKEKTVHELMGALINRAGYQEYLKAEYTEDEYEWKVENIEEFQSMATRYDGLLYPENLALFLEDIALITDQDRDNSEQWSANGFVSLMTVHLAKWLEFSHVFIAGAEEWLFPHSRSLLESSALEEERRLMYVAITRAKEMLYITRAHERYTFWSYSANPKSRFVKEIPEEYLEVDTNRWSAQSIFGTGTGGFSSFGSIFGNPLEKGGHGGLGSQKNQSSVSQARQLLSQGAKRNNASDFSMWDRVKHPQYGVGTIVTIKDVIADIAFSGMGIKKMNIEIAPIEKV